MQWVIVTGFLVTLVRFGGGKVPPTPILELHSTHTETPQVECLAGSEWESNCHFCHCTESGIAQCLKQDTCVERISADPMHCRPNTTFRNDCNTCICLDEGRPLCTRKLCLKITNGDVKEESNSEDEAEELGPPITKSSINNTKEVICAANRMFVKDCNTCWCNDDGTSYFCTRKVCVFELPDEPNIDEEKPEELRIIKKECRPDEVFELDCNMCRCNPDGKSFSCTRRACVDQEDVKNLTTLSRRVRATNSEKLKVCTPREEFRLDCNTCLCDDEGQSFSCTRIDCYKSSSRKKRGASDLQKITLACAAGSVFERDCNTCRCADNGEHAMCTNKNCQTTTKGPEPAKGSSDGGVHNTDSDPGFRCNPGEQFKRDCKDCTCSADGKSYFCTLRLCDEFIVPGI